MGAGGGVVGVGAAGGVDEGAARVGGGCGEGGEGEGLARGVLGVPGGERGGGCGVEADPGRGWLVVCGWGGGGG